MPTKKPGKLRQYEVTVEETVTVIYDVEAYSEQEARDSYDEGKWPRAEVDRTDWQIKSVKEVRT